MKNMKKNSALLAVLIAVFTFCLVQGPPQALAGPFDLKDLNLNDLQKGADTVKNLGEASKDWTYPEERATGRVIAAQVAANFGGIWNNGPWNNYVNMIGRGLVPYCKRPDMKYRFAILNSDHVNAYSCPGGYIFVTKGLLNTVENEAQLAAVLAHEISHAAKRHIEKQVKQQNQLSVMLNAGLEFASQKGDITDEQAKIIEQVSGAGYDVLIKTGYSREDEFQSDRNGTRNILVMGYNPHAMADFLEILGKGKKTSDLKILVSTHPASGDRVNKVKGYISEKGWKTDGLPMHEARFNNMKKKYPIR